jgi:hypothetical protein
MRKDYIIISLLISVLCLFFGTTSVMAKDSIDKIEKKENIHCWKHNPLPAVVCFNMDEEFQTIPPKNSYKGFPLYGTVHRNTATDQYIHPCHGSMSYNELGDGSYVLIFTCYVNFGSPIWSNNYAIISPDDGYNGIWGMETAPGQTGFFEYLGSAF